jgi:two-component system chemotaxis sensor kinase CheA
VIEVVDDGGGLNKDRIQAKAIEKGIIQPGETCPTRKSST